MKTCNKCGKLKCITDFSPAGDGTAKTRNACKECCRLYAAQYHLTHPPNEHAREIQRTWRAANKDRVAEINRRSRARHPYSSYTEEEKKRACAKSMRYSKLHPEYGKDERTRAYKRQWYLDNKDRCKTPEVRKRNKAWRDAHKEYYRTRDSGRREIYKGTKDRLTPSEWRAIKAAYAQKCAYCGIKCKKLTMDHVVPLSRGGFHRKDNIVPACIDCNLSKHAGPAPPHQRILAGLIT
jgi:hypothetical protein